MKFSFLLIGFALFSMASCTNEHTEKEEEATYTVSLPEKKDTEINREFVGQIRAYQHVELRALDEGYLQKIYVDEGQVVKQGQLLFQLMPIVYQAEKEAAFAELQRAEIEYQNTKTLSDNNVVSKNELALAKANLEKAKATLRLADAHLQFTEIRAPFDGIVGRFYDVRLGSLVDQGDLLTTLSDNSKMWVYFNVPEAVYLDFVNKNNAQDIKQEVQLQLADGTMFQNGGVIETIESDFNIETGNIAFRATFPNPQSILRHGQTGKVFMPMTLKNALLIPQMATYEVLDKKFVFIVKNGVIDSRQITVNHEMPHLYEVINGLTPSDTLLIEGLRKVKKGDAIHTHFKSQAEVLKDLNAIKAE